MLAVGTESPEAGAVRVEVAGLKNINDSRGHAVGDETLAWVARTCESVIAGRGLLTRSGGDEFTAVVPDRSIELVRDISRAIADALAEPLELRGLPVDLDVRVRIEPC